MKKKSEWNTREHRQAGVILVLFALTLPVLLGLLTLAIDCGNLYLARARLTKVARASSATALNMMALRGWGSLVADPEPSSGQLDLGLKTYNAEVSPPEKTSANEAILKEMHQSAIDALSAYYRRDFEGLGAGQSPDYLQYRVPGKASTSRSITLDYLDLSDSSVRLVIRYATPTYLLGAISQTLGLPTTCQKMGTEQTIRCWVESAMPPEGQTGKMRSAHVMMLLDVSGSMNEGASSGKTKAQSLTEAAAHFIDMFNPRSDRFAVIPYATTADVGTAPTLQVLDASQGTGARDYLPIKRDISSLEVGGQTNQCDALIQAIRAIEQDPQLQNPLTPKFVLLFTDGAPNVYRLSFCGDNNCSQPSRLQQALDQSGQLPNPDVVNPGWYGWTVKWDKREVFPIHYTFGAECPADGSAEKSTDGQVVPECDPVWALPKVVKSDGTEELSYEQVSSYLRLREDGEFVLKGGPYGSDGQLLSQLGYSLKFKDWLGSDLLREDYNYPDAFRWHGPSYLVHASFRIPRGFSLIDRIPQSLETGVDPAITCGPGSRIPYPGSVTQQFPGIADKYNHSRYFASRVVDQDWRWNATHTDESDDKADKTGLTLEQLKTAPAYFDRPHTLHGNPHDNPGCLGSLNAKVPFTDAKIYVGDNFVSNSSGSIAYAGEAVKTAELPYYCAVRAADYLRTQYGVVIFVVGLGSSATTMYGPTCQDPLQNSLDPNSRKDRFLRRLAFAPESLADPVSFMDRDPMDVDPYADWKLENDFRFRSGVSFGACSGIHPLANSNATMETGYGEDSLDRKNGFTPADHEFTPSHLGAYYAADNPEELKMIFGEIAKRMLLRLAT
jgi:hypothetical protein